MAEEKVDAWMPLWIGAYLADTMDLSRDEHGGYLLLLMAYWRNKGPLPDKGNKLANICKASASEWRILRPVLAEFFEEVDGHWVHGRADKELEAAGMRKAAASSKAKAAAEARWGKAAKHSSEQCSEHAPGTPQAVPEQCPTPSPKEKVSKASPSHPPAGGKAARFEDFWLAWPKTERKHDKAKCLDHWKRHNLDPIADLILADVRTKRGTQKWAEGYIEAPLVYLRGRRWEDGVTPNEGEPGQAVAQWWENGAGISAKGVELGLGPWKETEQFPTYRARVFAKAGPGPWNEPAPAGLPGVLKTTEPA